jgi:CxxC motif-containing protein (DUF1111 family)
MLSARARKRRFRFLHSRRVSMRRVAAKPLLAPLFAAFVAGSANIALADDAFAARDPGVRTNAGSGNPLSNLPPGALEFFNMGKVAFLEAEAVGDGLGPRMNLDNCGGCHAQPAVGGTSPSRNPQFALARLSRAKTDVPPPFLSADGPVRVVRLLKNADGTPDGTVHPVLTIAGRPDARGCDIDQFDLAAEVAKKNIAFRIPTPLFGAGLIEQIPDSAIRANQERAATRNRSLGIRGRPNIARMDGALPSAKANDGDGPIGRFGWKAQNASLLVAGAEAYHDEMGITNELFPTERNESLSCDLSIARYEDMKLEGLPPIDSVRRYLNPLGHRYPLEVAELRARIRAFAERNPPGDYLGNSDDQAGVDTVTSIEKFASFMRYLAPPVASQDLPGGADSIRKGRHLFDDVGCAGCHSPSLRTGSAKVAALRDQVVNLYSDLLLHEMGPNLADGVSQGRATVSEFRTAPLWGVGQRIYFLHDGRTQDLRIAIYAHRSGSLANGNASEANTVVDRFDALGEHEKQDVLNFLRSL